MPLDRTNENIGYRLGRLFAVLEGKEDWYELNAKCMTNPMQVLPFLISKFKGEEIGEFKDIQIPSYLTAEGMWNYSLGYYHQKRADSNL